MDKGRTLARPSGYGWLDNVAIADMTNWRILPYDPVAWHIKRKSYPKLGKFGLLFGLIEWAVKVLLESISRTSVSRMPLNWRRQLIELNNARVEADRLDKAQQDAANSGGGNK